MKNYAFSEDAFVDEQHEVKVKEGKYEDFYDVHEKVGKWVPT